jgi:hypothetical protein
MKDSIFKSLLEATKAIVAGASKLNRKEREEIRAVVGELLDTLCDSLDMTIIYLNHTKHARDHELVDHLMGARSALNHSFREFKVCGGLYNLRDRFSRILDPVRATVDIRRIGEIGFLVNDLACGERNILDYLEGTGTWMRENADKLANLPPGSAAWDKAKKSLLADLQSQISVLQDMRNDLKRDVRHLIDVM